MEDGERVWGGQRARGRGSASPRANVAHTAHAAACRHKRKHRCGTKAPCFRALTARNESRRMPPFDSVMSEVREHKAKTALPAVQSGIGEIGGSEFALLHTTPCPHKSTSTQIDGAARCAPVETLTDPLESQASASQCHERHRAEPISPAVR